MEQSRRYLIAYDVADDARRSRIAKKLESYGDRVQFSVFVVDARPARLVRLRRELSTLIEQRQDSVLLCDLGLVANLDSRRFELLGRSRPILGSGPIVV